MSLNPDYNKLNKYLIYKVNEVLRIKQLTSCNVQQKNCK